MPKKKVMSENEYTALFEKLIKDKGWNFRRATPDEDRLEHIDGHVTVMNGSKACCAFSVDLKGDKFDSKANKGDIKHLCQYIELLNVRGNKGWVFGKADYIAILNEANDGFYLIKRIDMISFCEDMFDMNFNDSLLDITKELNTVGCEKALWSDSPYNSFHRLYHRPSRPDEAVTQIDMNDVKELCKIKI